MRLTGPGMERIEVDKRDEVSIDGLVVVHPITILLTVDSRCECYWVELDRNLSCRLGHTMHR